MKRLGIVRLGLAISLLTVSASVATVASIGTQPALAASPPNIVLILTDDMRWDEMENMPTVQSELIGKGTWFQNGFVVNSLCCPSRTTILTGKYSHDSGVWTNTGSHGGFASFKSDGSTVATWLHAAGYHTGLIGKYMNGYSSKNASYIPPGWDEWRTFLQPPGYFNYSLDINGTPTAFGNTPADYSTDVLGGYAADFIRNTPAGQPLFLDLTPYGPHAPFTPAPRYANALPGYQSISPPNAGEADVSDKPAWVQALPKRGGNWNATRKLQEQTLLAVDDAVAGILSALSDTGRLSNTLIVFSSDNGLSGGSHRWGPKEVGWEESIRVPIVLRFDPLTQGTARTDAHLALNLDLASTFAAAAGVSSPGAQGMSLLPLADGTATTWRSEFGIEHYSTGKNPPSYCGVRTDRYKYIEYSTHEEELYDLQADPFELNSLDKDPAYAALKAGLHADTVSICSPPTPGFSF